MGKKEIWPEGGTPLFSVSVASKGLTETRLNVEKSLKTPLPPPFL
jgi:hypothetical protein